MPHQNCPRCQRANPADAVYCWFDGMMLQQGMSGPSLAAVPGRFSHAYRFPSGRSCVTVDEFVEGCQYEWEDARELLKARHFSQFFSHVGRRDLAELAAEAERSNDPDVGLHQLLRSMPAQVQGPRLDVTPRRLNLGILKAGETRRVTLQINNQGRGILQGKLAVAEANGWLRVETSNGDFEQTTLKAPREQKVVLKVDTRGLPPKSYGGRLMIVTNGGVAEVPVRMELGVVPFAHAPYQGAVNPRDLAERMKKNPKPAVALLENGQIQRWFNQNGWNYPIRGVTAAGIASVQQFFEGMGLSRPPALQISEQEIQCLCVVPEVVPLQVQLKSNAKKWVYAQVDADVTWVRVTTPNVSGVGSATVGFEIDSSELEENHSHEGRVKIQANGGQTFNVRVRADVKAPQRGRRRTTVTGRETLPAAALAPFLVLALTLFIYRLVLVVPGDLLARTWTSTRETPPPGSVERWKEVSVREDGFTRRFLLTTFWVGTLAGAVLVWPRRTHVVDVLCGTLAGTMAGLAGALTIACVVALGDTLPRLLIGLLGSGTGQPALWTLIWIILVSLWWGLLGLGLGLALSGAGQRGRRLMGHLTRPLVAVLQSCGLNRVAMAFTIQ